MTLTAKIVNQSFENGMNGVVTIVELVITKNSPEQKVAQLTMHPQFGFQGIVKCGMSYTEGEPTFPCTLQFNVDQSKKLNLVVKGDDFPKSIGIKLRLLFATASDIRQCTGFDFDESFNNMNRPIAMTQSGQIYEIVSQVTFHGKQQNKNWGLPQAGAQEPPLPPAGSCRMTDNTYLPQAIRMVAEMVAQQEQMESEQPVGSESENMEHEPQPDGSAAVSCLRLKVITADTESLSVKVPPSANVHVLKVN